MSRTKRLFDRAIKVMPGGHQGGGWRYIAPYNMYFQRAFGSRLYTVDGDEYIDYHLAFGPIILGHCHPKVVRAVNATSKVIDLLGVGGIELEVQASEMISRNVPCAEMVRFITTGSEATYGAIRAARAYTRRNKILKFEGSFHGWHDYVYMSVTPPSEKLGIPYAECEGILPDAMSNTIIAPFNDFETIEKTVRDNKDTLAAVIVEPIQHNIGCIMPKEGFLESVREVTERYGVLLIFDEVITGFRHSIGGIQKLWGIQPDISTWAKAMANGYPIAAITGTKEIMTKLSPATYGAGTYCGHPISLAATVATIKELESGKVHEHIKNLGDMARKGLSRIISDFNIRGQVAGFQSIFLVYFTDASLDNYGALLSNDNMMFQRYNEGMRKRRIFLHPWPLKRGHISAAHTRQDIQKLINAAEKVMQEISSK